MDNFRKLLPTLILYQHNLHVLHWKLRGVDFDPVHSLLGEYYETLAGFVDEVGEISLMLGIEPMGLKESIDFLLELPEEFEELKGSESFSSLDCFSKINNYFTQLIGLYNASYQDITEPNIVNKLQEQAYWFVKECKYKNNQRLK